MIDAEKLRRLEQEIQRLENELLEGDMRHTAAKSQLEFALAERLDSLMACEAKIEELAIKNAELVERLQKDTESSEAANVSIYYLLTLRVAWTFGGSGEGRSNGISIPYTLNPIPFRRPL